MRCDHESSNLCLLFRSVLLCTLINEFTCLMVSYRVKVVLCVGKIVH